MFRLRDYHLCKECIGFCACVTVNARNLMRFVRIIDDPWRIFRVSYVMPSSNDNDILYVPHDTRYYHDERNPEKARGPPVTHTAGAESKRIIDTECRINSRFFHYGQENWGKLEHCAIRVYISGIIIAGILFRRHGILVTCAHECAATFCHRGPTRSANERSQGSACCACRDVFSSLQMDLRDLTHGHNRP